MMKHSTDSNGELEVSKESGVSVEGLTGPFLWRFSHSFLYLHMNVLHRTRSEMHIFDDLKLKLPLRKMDAAHCLSTIRASAIRLYSDLALI